MARLTISEQLDQVRDSVAGCQVVAFADLSAGLVLCVSAARRPAQEALDSLCAMASDLLDGTAAESAARLLGEGPAIDCAVSLPAGRTYAFLRSANDPVEALCCLGAPEMDLDLLLAAGRATLAGIEQLT